jgi:5-methyltetrahydropteroyltriglutamate--homocysteine methyltransferase
MTAARHFETNRRYDRSVSIVPPYRADIVGSFLRPEALKRARAEHSEGAIDADALAQIEDAAIADLVVREKDAGLQLATDGEFRRSWWHFDFFGFLDGVDIVELDHGIQFQGVQTKPKGVEIDGKIGFSPEHPFLEHFRSLRDLLANTTGATPKFSIPAPTVLDFRLEPGHIDSAFYDGRDAIVDDLVQAYRDAVQAFYNEGARYLQFDDTAWAYLCSDAELAKARERGIDTDGIAERYSSLLNRVLEGKPDDLVVTTHVGYFLEYDSERAGGFEPLRFLPEGDKTVVLGLITSKSGELENVGAVKKRIDEASAFAPLGQLALSPQCGFASTEEGNVLTEDEQWAKVREVVDIAADVWK